MTKFNHFYWLLPILIIAGQLVYTVNSVGQIRTEELIDSIRSPWWFQNHLVTDGGYSNLGWYTILNLTYNIFGFSLYTAKFVRLTIAALAFVSLAALLKKTIGTKAAIIPFLIIGLSPTMLYFTTLQIAYGIDVHFFLICLFLLSLIDFNKKWQAYILEILVFAISMLAWLSYGAFVYFLPLIGAYYLYKLFNGSRIKSGMTKVGDDRMHILIILLAFIMPLILEVAYIQNRQLLFFDRTIERGLFRSNGGFELNANLLFDNLKILGNDLFIAPSSYYFETPKVEFSDFYPVISIIFIVIITFIIFIKKKLRLPLLILGSIGIYLLVINLVGPAGLGGIRRGMVILVLFYGLFVWVWFHLRGGGKVGLAILSLLLVHHILVYPINLAHLKIPTPYRDQFWFAQANTPEKSLELFVNKTQAGNLSLQCVSEDQKVVNCKGYSLIHAGVAGSCYWNKLNCGQIDAYDTALNKFIPLTFDFYKDNNWER